MQEGYLRAMQEWLLTPDTSQHLGLRFLAYPPPS